LIAKRSHERSLPILAHRSQLKRASTTPRVTTVQ